MSHGHDAHDAHDGHAHASAPVGSHGPLEFPPVPDPRSITPAREDFEAPWPGRLLVSPIVWTVVALLFFVAARSLGHKIGEHDAEAHEAGHGGEAEPGSEAPHGAEPAMGEDPK